MVGLFLGWILFGFIASGLAMYDEIAYRVQIELKYPPTYFHGHLSFNYLSIHNSELVSLRISSLLLTRLEIFNSDNQAIPVKSVETTKDRWDIRISDIFWANETYKFYVEYRGRIDEKNSGFTSIKYRKKDGNLNYLLTSNYNGNFGSVMPHIVDSQMGIIQLSVNVPTNWTAIFNSIEDFNSPSKNTVRFKTTRKISFNNFLLIIGDFSKSVKRSKYGTLVRSFIPRGFDNFLEKTASVPAKCLSAVESYFEQPLNGNKIDHINVIGDWPFVGNGIAVYPKNEFSIWDNSPANDLLKQNLLICKQTILSWLNGRRDLEDSEQVYEALSLFLSYRLIALYENSEYASVVKENMAKLSNGKKILSYNDYPKRDPLELAAIFLMIDDSLEKGLFDEAIYNFVQMIQDQVNGSVFPTLIEAFKMATNYRPICGSIMVENFLNSWINHIGPVYIKISLKDGEYSIQQTSYPLRIVPLIISEPGQNQLSTRWLMPSGEICYQGIARRLDSQIPYIFNSNGRSYTRIEYSDEIHRLLIDDGVWKIPPSAQYVYIRDLDEQARSSPEKLNNLLEFISNSFVDTQQSIGSPIFVEKALFLLDFYHEKASNKVDDIMKRQIQNLHNFLFWDPEKQFLRNAILSNQVFRLSVINRIGGSRLIASRFYELFLKKCAPSFECDAFPIEILSAVLCGSVIENENEQPKQLLLKMMDDLKKRYNLFLLRSAKRIFKDALNCETF